MRKPSRDIITLNVCNINNNHIMYGSWDMDPVTDRFFCHFGLFFALLSPLHSHNPPPPTPPHQPPPKKNFEKMKKLAGDIIILHMCTINNNHLIYGSWDIERIGQIFLSFWTNFLPIYPKHPNFEKTNKMPRESSNPSKLSFGYFHHSLVNFENLIILFWNIWVIYRVQIRKEK